MHTALTREAREFQALAETQAMAATEQVGVEFRFESFNAFNHTQWNFPTRNVADPHFGEIRSARDARINQFGLKVVW